MLSVFYSALMPAFSMTFPILQVRCGSPRQIRPAMTFVMAIRV